MEARGIRLQGERGISRQTIAQGMPECSGCTCMLVCASLCIHCTRDRGCSEHPAFPAPSVFGEGTSSCKPRAQCVARTRSISVVTSCAQLRMGRTIQYSRDSSDGTIGRGVLDTRLRGYDVPSSLRAQRSNPSCAATMDCFASLAMTRMGRSAPDTPACVGYRRPFGAAQNPQAGSAIEVHQCQSRPCERPSFGFKLTMTD